MLALNPPLREDSLVPTPDAVDSTGVAAMGSPYIDRDNPPVLREGFVKPSDIVETATYQFIFKQGNQRVLVLPMPNDASPHPRDILKCGKFHSRHAQFADGELVEKLVSIQDMIETYRAAGKAVCAVWWYRSLLTDNEHFLLSLDAKTPPPHSISGSHLVLAGMYEVSEGSEPTETPTLEQTLQTAEGYLYLLANYRNNLSRMVVLEVLQERGNDVLEWEVTETLYALAGDSEAYQFAIDLAGINSNPDAWMAFERNEQGQWQMDPTAPVLVQTDRHANA